MRISILSKLGLATIGLSSRAIVPHIPLREESEVWSIRSPGHLGPGVRGGAGIIPHIKLYQMNISNLMNVPVMLALSLFAFGVLL